ncbi:MAG: VCBS repeat-containing protein [Balneola sp.]|nr:MAG: VCBS repeat-containing protein [Balneola sp.]
MTKAISIRVALCSTIVFLSLACGPAIKKSPSADQVPTYTRFVDPFPVFYGNGEKMDHPFLGGLNTPRPQFLDIDADGDPDLFVQEHTNELMFFENTDPDSDAPLTFRTDKYQNLDIGEWFRFIDMDKDGDFDLLTEKPFSYLSFYRNEGSAKEPVFVLVADSLKDAEGSPIFSDRQNIPNVTDIDSDGLLDLFIGSLDGTVSRYESIGDDENGLPRFQLLTTRFQNIEIVNEFGSMHGANTMTFMDIDSDGDQDIFWGDFFEPGVLLLENTGSSTNPNFQRQPQKFPPNDPVATSGYNAPALIDWGNDGDSDLFLGVLGGAFNANLTIAENFYFYEQEDKEFTLVTRQFLKIIDIGDESIPAVGDIDGDGDMDLLLANKIDPYDLKSSKLYGFENRGDVNNPEFHLMGTLNLPGAYHFAPELADLNGDGLADLLLGNWKGQVDFFPNTGSNFGSVVNELVKLPRGSNAVPRAVDIDADGDLDLVLGSSGGDLYHFENTGSKTEPVFTLREETFQGIETRHRSAPAFNDMDGDGDLDLMIGSKIEGIFYFRNDGDAKTPNFIRGEMPFPVATAPLSTPLFVDIDGDSINEFFVGTRSGGMLYYHLRK